MDDDYWKMKIEGQETKETMENRRQKGMFELLSKIWISLLSTKMSWIQYQVFATR